MLWFVYEIGMKKKPKVKEGCTAIRKHTIKRKNKLGKIEREKGNKQKVKKNRKEKEKKNIFC